MQERYEKQTSVNYQLQDGFHELLLKDCETLKLHIEAGKRVNGSLLVTYAGVSSDIDVEVNVHSGSHVSILFWNQMKEQIQIKQVVHAYGDARAHIGFGDISDCASTYDIHVDLLQGGADVTVTSACVADKKHMNITMKHDAAHTSGLMNNYAIVKEHGDYAMEAIGTIVKGAHDSASHQATRVLTLAQNQKSEVTPVLLIDENEVKASHATTLGQPDENQLYYLQSRGLSREQALGLLTAGYLMPILDVLPQREIRERLQSEIEEKVIRNA